MAEKKKPDPSNKSKRPATPKPRSKARSKKAAPLPADLPPMVMMEQMMRQMFGGGGMDAEPTAQDFAFQAAAERDPKKAAELLTKAFELDPHCVDALLVFSRFTDKPGSDDRLQHLLTIVSIGEENLGKQFFEENKGMFWGLLETRPYMRARRELAVELEKRGQLNEAVEHFQAMLELNPGDNQGLRYELLGHLLTLKRLDEAMTLMSQYDEDGAMWLWGKVLLKFLSTGDGESTRAGLQMARKANPFAEHYLSGAKKLPKKLPGHYGIGDENEAIVCAVELGSAWQQHPTAMAWLKAQA